jgi:acetyl-CoA carboxylase biotin carboxyl carrier protein
MSDEDNESRGPFNLMELSSFVDRLTQMAQKSGLTSLEIKTDDLKVKIRVGDRRGPVPAARANGLGDAIAEPSEAPTAALTGSVITSPMVGTFYHAPSPSDPPLVQVGDRIEVGQVIGIIEAMKIMNEIASDRNGLVVEIIASNGTPVEYGSPLVRVAP